MKCVYFVCNIKCAICFVTLGELLNTAALEQNARGSKVATTLGIVNDPTHLSLSLKQKNQINLIMQFSPVTQGQKLEKCNEGAVIKKRDAYIHHYIATMTSYYCREEEVR